MGTVPIFLFRVWYEWFCSPRNRKKLMYPTPSRSDHAVRFPSHFHSTTLIADVEEDGEEEVSPLPPHIEEVLRKLEKALKDIKKEVYYYALTK